MGDIFCPYPYANEMLVPKFRCVIFKMFRIWSKLSPVPSFYVPNICSDPLGKDGIWINWFVALWCLMTLQNLVNIGFRNGFLPNGTKTVHGPMLTNYEWQPLALNWGQFMEAILDFTVCKLCKNNMFEKCRGQKWMTSKGFQSYYHSKWLTRCISILR